MKALEGVATFLAHRYKFGGDVVALRHSNTLWDHIKTLKGADDVQYDPNCNKRNDDGTEELG